MSDKKVTPPPMRKMVLLKLKLNALIRQCTSTASSAVQLLFAVAAVGAMLYMSTRAPEVHDAYLRWNVGSRVYKIQGQLKGGGGTGFALKAPSGTNYIITNSHVCDHVKDLSPDKNSVLVVSDDGSAVRRRIISISDQTDLCLVEGMPGIEGLSLGSEPGVGQTVYVLGHPHLRPLTLQHGEIVGQEDIEILDHIISTGDPFLDILTQANATAACNMPKNRIVEVPIMMGIMGQPPQEVGKLKLCIVVTEGAYLSTVTIFPGNSGSPVVDFWGKVVGVAFASDSTNWGSIVSIDDLREFIRRY
jgi:S1-C subfamily serine protease